MMIDPAASGPDTHLDPDRMADLYDGLLDQDAADSARLHLAACSRCADDFALITLDSGLSDMLSLEPIPEAVAIRVEAALHREPPLTAAPAPAQHAASPGRVRRFRLFGSLAAATLVIAGAFAGISALVSGANTRSTSAKTSSSYVSGQSGDSQAAQAPGSSSAMAPNGLISPRPGALAPADSAASIQAQAEQLLKASTSTQSGPQSAAGSTEKAEGLRIACPPQGLQNTSPLGMTSITYQGQPAELLVYAKPGEDSAAAVYVVATAGCTDQAPGRVLYSTEVSRR